MSCLLCVLICFEFLEVKFLLSKMEITIKPAIGTYFLTFSKRLDLSKSKSDQILYSTPAKPQKASPQTPNIPC